MTPPGLATLRRSLLGVPEARLSLEMLGFSSQDRDRVAHLQRIPVAFARGYHAALEEAGVASLHERLETENPQEMKGFAYEGAGMGLALRDLLHPLGGDLLRRFIDGPAAPHTYMAHIGAGWAIARVPFRTRWLLDRLHPRYRWLAIEGYGFHQVFFRARATLDLKRPPSRVNAEELPVYHQGVGRCLWFARVADAAAIADAIAGFPEALRPELWAGVGLAATYAGGMSDDELEVLLESTGVHLARFAQGVLFAATARRRAGTDTPHSDRLAHRVWGTALDDAVAAALREGEEDPLDSSVRTYRRWCSSLATRFSGLP